MTTISPSAVETYLLCQRRWGFQRLDGLPRSSSPGADLGTRCHELWAKYLTDGTSFDLTTIEGRICHATQHLLPVPGPAIEVEKSFVFEFDGVLWGGIKDAAYWFRKGSVWAEPPPNDGKTFRVVLDHKTTSNLRYAKTDRESLLSHPQAPCYAMDEFSKMVELYPLELAWNYVQHGVQFDKETGAMKARSKPYALDPPVRIDVTKTEAEERLGVFTPPAKRMLQLINDPPAKVDGFHAKALEPTPSACNAFHTQCPYAIQCALTPHDIASRLVTIGKVSTMSSMSERIAQMRADKAPTHSSGTAARQIEEQIAAQKAAGADRASQAVAMNQSLALQAAFTTPVYGPINPPEQGLGAQGTAPAGPADMGAQGQVLHLAVGGLAPPLPAAPATDTTPRRGRPPGSRNRVKSHTTVGEVEPLAENFRASGEDTGDTIPAPSATEAALDRLVDIAERIAVALEARTV